MNPLPTLIPHTELSRPLSTPEYYHACIGKSPHTLESAREIVFVVEGEGAVSGAAWRGALDKLVDVHPALRWRMVGQRRQARWQSDGKPAALRFVADTGWDGHSEQGAEFIEHTRLSLEEGPTSELIIEARELGSRVIFRTLHAVMDGRGVMFILQELFRALRGEPLAGANATFCDVDLMRAVGATASTSKHVKTVALTGASQGGETGDTWCRLSFDHPGKDLLPRLAATTVEFVHQQCSDTVLIAVPVDLRRHLPDIRSPHNFSSMLQIPLQPGEGAAEFRAKLDLMLQHQMETYYSGVLDLAKLLPLSWFDYLVSRRPGNYRRRKPLETAVISNVGRFDSASLSGGGFQARALFGLPLRGNTFCFLFSLDDRLELTIGLPRVLASNGRFQAFLNLVQARLGASATVAAPVVSA